ncbi:hypothetical protein B0H15DRAFT_857009 [Mycena belliarum]|uniref:Uncharacterized protein n=1 Tax=Mycena belliarum TaxID=1033014 RepID=A0AAD6U0B0_9AGAR|nr:hypothetical protein B0H15DRAFT_857009 [Mycena belliae]
MNFCTRCILLAKPNEQTLLVPTASHLRPCTLPLLRFVTRAYLPVYAHDPSPFCATLSSYPIPVHLRRANNLVLSRRPDAGHIDTGTSTSRSSAQRRGRPDGVPGLTFDSAEADSAADFEPEPDAYRERGRAWGTELGCASHAGVGLFGGPQPRVMHSDSCLGSRLPTAWGWVGGFVRRTGREGNLERKGEERELGKARTATRRSREDREGSERESTVALRG